MFNRNSFAGYLLWALILLALLAFAATGVFIILDVMSIARVSICLCGLFGLLAHLLGKHIKP